LFIGSASNVANKTNNASTVLFGNDVI